MNVSVPLLTNIILVLALVVWVGYRQSTWRAVDASRMWRLPIILGGIGVLTLAEGGDSSIIHVSGPDVSLLVIELVLGSGIGALMGVCSSFRPISEASRARLAERTDRKGRDSSAAVRLEVRTGWVGLLLWIALIAVRIGVGVVAGIAGAHLTASAGVVMLAFAVNRAARIAVILARADRVATPKPVASLA